MAGFWSRPFWGVEKHHSLATWTPNDGAGCVLAWNHPDVRHFEVESGDLETFLVSGVCHDVEQEIAVRVSEEGCAEEVICRGVG